MTALRTIKEAENVTREFTGTIEVDIRDSVPDWAPYLAPKAPVGAPNVLFIVWDDVGYGTMDCFGGPVRTPTMTRIADRGVRYSNFHTTALCSPTRASLLTDRNATSNGMATIAELSSGFPGISTRIPFENGFISEVLLENGYNTYWVGKWHLTPGEETGMAAWKKRWPLGRGSERFYGFLGGESSGCRRGAVSPRRHCRGHSLSVQDGRLRYVFNWVGTHIQTVTADRPVGTGARVITAEFVAEGRSDDAMMAGGTGTLTLYVDGDAVGSESIVTQPGLFCAVGDGLCVGRDDASPVSPTYTSPFAFTGGTIDKVVVDVFGERYRDHEAEVGDGSSLTDGQCGRPVSGPMTEKGP